MLKQTSHKECNFQTVTTDASSSFPVVLYLKSSICPSFPFTLLEWLLPRTLTSLFLRNLKIFSSSSSIMTFLLCRWHLIWHFIHTGLLWHVISWSTCTSYHPQYPFQQHLFFTHSSAFCVLPSRFWLKCQGEQKDQANDNKLKFFFKW